jgi:hypothetical protein
VRTFDAAFTGASILAHPAQACLILYFFHFS